jgi:hypothetical protein
MDDAAAETPTKVCSTCKQPKPLDDFNRRSTAKDGRQWSCRACNSQYHQANWDRHMAQIRLRRKQVRRANRELLWAYLASHPCADCGEADPLVLEFDHLRDKRGDISVMKYGYTWPTLLAEIEKCEVVCANCHRRRTYRRDGSWRANRTAELEVGRLGFEPRPTTG